MSELSIVIPGEPVAKGRPRATTVGGHARMYTPAKTRVFENLVASCAYGAMNGRPLLAGPLRLFAFFYRGIPKSFSKKKTIAADAGEIFPVTRPDFDNYLKGTLDGLNGVVFADDSQVVAAHVYKFYSLKPRTEITIRSLEGQDDTGELGQT